MTGRPTPVRTWTLMCVSLGILIGCAADFPGSPEAPSLDATTATDATIETLDANQPLDVFAAVPDVAAPLDAAGTPAPVDMMVPMDAAPPVGDVGVVQDAFIPNGERYNEAVFGASHNSYSGGRHRGSLPEQLNAGVRCVELDLHDNGFGSIQDWKLGHIRDGAEVMEGDGNPDSNHLSEWLRAVRSWSRDNQGHAPLTLILDIKDSLADNDGPDEGNLGALNQRIVEIFGAALYPRYSLGNEWPTVANLRDRVLVLLSGDEETRRKYLYDVGYDPVVFVNASGKVIEMHHSGTGRLWYWTGQKQPDGSVHWYHHARHVNGMDPSVALLDDGTILEVHKSQNRSRLFYTVGSMRDDYTVDWEDDHSLVDGSRPSLRVRPDGDFELIYESSDGQLRFRMAGEVDDEEIDWGDAIQTDQLRFDNTRSRDIRVFTRSDGEAPMETLLYTVGASPNRRIIYRQNLFVEYQPNNSPAILESARFFAAERAPQDLIRLYRGRGPVRQWGFDLMSRGARPLPNFPATDEPLKAWYHELMRAAGAVDWP